MVPRGVVCSRIQPALELQEMAKQWGEMPEGTEKEEKCWLRRLARSDYLVEQSRSSSPSHDSAASVMEPLEPIDKPATKERPTQALKK